MTKKQTKCSTGKGKGIDEATLDDAAVLMPLRANVYAARSPVIGEKLAHLADAHGLDLSVEQGCEGLMFTATERRTGMDLIVTNKIKRLRRYIIAYSQGRDAGIAEAIGENDTI